MNTVLAGETAKYHRQYKLFKWSMLAAIAVAFLMFSREMVVNAWLAKKNNVSCVPATVTYGLPFAYYQSAAHPVQNDAEIKAFIEKYVRLTKNQSAVDYHQPTRKARYSSVGLSKNLWEAIELSEGVEKKWNEKQYYLSSDTFRFLKEKNVGWIFNIDTILVEGIADAGAARVTVRGEYQITYDHAKVEVPHTLYGYKEIIYMVIIGSPTTDDDGNFYNRTGYFVIDSFERDLSPIERKILNNQNASFYLENHRQDRAGDK
nr:hypothetical protein BdHM001_35030 [Bdellovibrio sp. HM001]